MVPFSVTLNDPIPDLKGTPLFSAEYVRNSKRQRHSNSAVLIGTYALLSGVISHDLE